MTPGGSSYLLGIKIHRLIPLRVFKSKVTTVKYEFTNTKKLVKKLARVETSSICRQQFANMFANCLSCEGRFRGRHYCELHPLIGFLVHYRGFFQNCPVPGGWEFRETHSH